MDYLQILLRDVGPRLVERLTGENGFSAESAERFVPAAAGAALDFLRDRGASVDLTDLAGVRDALVDGLDAEALGSVVGVDAEVARTGLASILPPLLSAADEKARLFGGLAGVAERFGSGSASPLSGLASKLFGR